jgi:hypothetical protein
VTFYAGLTLSDSRALSILEVTSEPTAEPPIWNRRTGRIDTRAVYHLRLARRLPGDAPYQDTIAQVADILAGEPIAGRCVVVADIGDSGRPLATLLRESLRDVICATVSETATATSMSGGYTIARSEMVSGLRLVLEQGAIKIPPALLGKLNGDAACMDALMLAVWWTERTRQRGDTMGILHFARNAAGELRFKLQ